MLGRISQGNPTAFPWLFIAGVNIQKIAIGCLPLTVVSSHEHAQPYQSDCYCAPGDEGAGPEFPPGQGQIADMKLGVVHSVPPALRCNERSVAQRLLLLQLGSRARSWRVRERILATQTGQPVELSMPRPNLTKST
jgi:hypothetical protein